MTKKERIIKEKILENYCRVKPHSIVAEVQQKLGDDVIIKLLNNFSGRLIYLPSKSSLKRAALPMLVKAELKGLVPGSDLFKAKVKILSKFYKLTQKAIKQINRKGIFLR